MTEAPTGDEWIDEVADRFEETWRTGPPPRIEDFLEGNSAAGRTALLEELVCIDVHRRKQAGDEPLLTDYQNRFPDDREAAEAGFRAAIPPGPPSDTEPISLPAAFQLLMGSLALQHNFVDRDALMGALDAWIADKSQSVGEILVEHDELSAARLALLESLAAQTLQQYGGDANLALASRGSLEAIRAELARMADAELAAAVTQTAPVLNRSTDGPMTQDDGYRLAQVRYPEGRYRVIRRINQGGQGDIFLAMDQSLNRQVALKRLRKRYAYSPDLQARLLLEAEVAARLEHPSFLPVHFAGFDRKGRPYFVMRYIEGDSSLKSRIDEFHGSAAGLTPDQRAQGLRKLLRHFVDVCYAVAYAHDRGVIHRDIKPGNVLVGQFGETYLVDWGMVKFTGRSASPGAWSGQALLPSGDRHSAYTIEGGGTPAFMSPEQVARCPLDFATDVYSLGVLLYALLTGQNAFTGETRSKVEAKILRGEFFPPRHVDGRVPAALEAVCLKAMRREPADRYASAKDMARDLEDWMADRPIGVYSEHWLMRARRWARNHRPAAVGMAVLLATSFLCMIVTSVLVVREQGRTEVNFGLARNAVLHLVRLARVPPRAKEVRDEIARTALGSAQKFLASRPRDRAVRLDLAQTNRAIANIGRAVGEVENPQHLYQQGADLLAALQAEFPADLAIAEEQALNSIDTGDFWLTNGQPARSNAFFEQVLSKLEATPRGLTAAQQHVKALALLNLARAHNQTDRARTAKELGIRAVELLNSLGDKTLRQPEEALILAHTQVGIAELLLGNGRESDVAFGQAVQQGENLIKTGKDIPQVKHALACALRYQAETRAGDPSRSQQAFELLRQASQHLNSLATEHPHVLEYQRDLAVCNIEIVDLNLAREDITDLLRSREGAGEVIERLNADAEEELGTYAANRELFDYHRHLGRALAQRARIAVVKREPKTARSLYDRAVEELENAFRISGESSTDRRLLERAKRDRAALP
jgi:tetratricopeptide (TPR) repeat protein/tRNA A-37 threonylcarbamoyl transferase component Bud32